MGTDPAATDPALAVWAALDRLAPPAGALGVALSGGGDSTALMQIAAEWARSRGRALAVATVDHALRPESAAEARQAGDAARALGLDHDILTWRDHGAGNVMAQARQARLRLLSQWARGRGLAAVLLGHTQDDLAETLLMRLSRGAGLDGLAAMAGARQAQDMLWLRPMLAVGRAELRDWLRGRGIGWVDDPSNDDPGFDRARIRQALAALGLDTAALAQSARLLAQARAALDLMAGEWARQAQAAQGALHLPAALMQAAPPETRRRVLLAAVRWVTGAGYAPRESQTAHALSAFALGRRATLAGALLDPRGATLLIHREPAAAGRSPTVTGGTWDERWRVPDLPAGQHWGALGHAPLPGLDWRGAGFDRDQAAALPAIWQGRALIAAPLIDGHALRPQPLRDRHDFTAMFAVH
ncbi:tRNA lysidine(34) synthetase TilS [Paracoccus jiaweipingae]|uniref:tRNA lysidine(34) synthetase TilS n=1 Tax=unclassified Paracoccus (in: a-proteobacteria) TaxID=2688777 RepID=UPI00379A8D19